MIEPEMEIKQLKAMTNDETERALMLTKEEAARLQEMSVPERRRWAEAIPPRNRAERRAAARRR